jgi:acyl carrier protein
MRNPFQRDEILAVVHRSVVDALGCDPAEANEDSAIADELGADSLDFVEITYALEQRLGFTLPTKSILEHAAEQLGSSNLLYGASGLTETGLYFLEHSFFRFTRKQIHVGMQPYQILASATIGNWANLCHELFSYLPDTCPECSHQEARVAPNGKVVCDGCGAGVKPISGDRALSAYVSTLIERLRLAA